MNRFHSRPGGFGPTTKAMICALMLLGVLAAIGSCQGAPPDPVFRMESPSGCSGGWIHASRQYGLWGATCSHCVAKAGQTVRLRLFQNGYKSPTIIGYCFAAVKGHDAAIIRVPPQNYRFELPLTFNLSPYGPAPGETVFAVGSFAGGSVTPAARKVAVTGFQRSGYQFSLNDTAWGGHSGGAVVDEQGNLVGVLWGAGTGYSVVTSSRAIWETLYGSRPRRVQTRQPSTVAMFAVDDRIPGAIDKPKQMAAPTVKVYATTSELASSGFLKALHSDPNMLSIKWQFENPHRVPASQRPRFTWHDGKTTWTIDGWKDLESLCARFSRANSEVWPVDYCPTCPPSYGRGGYGGSFGGRIGQTNPLNPWSGIVPPPPGGGNSGSGNESTLLRDRLKELEDAARKAKRDHEDELRRLKNASEDELRKLRQQQEDQLRKLRQQSDATWQAIQNANAAGGENPAVPGNPQATRGNVADPFESAIQNFRESRRRVRDREQRLKDAAERIDNETQPVVTGNRDWVLPGSIVAAALALAGGLYLKK